MAYWEHLVEKDNRQEARRDLPDFQKRATLAVKMAIAQGMKEKADSVEKALKNVSVGDYNSVGRLGHEVSMLEKALATDET